MLAFRDVGKTIKKFLRLLVTICFVVGIFFSGSAFLFAQDDYSNGEESKVIEEESKDEEQESGAKVEDEIDNNVEQEPEEPGFDGDENMEEEQSDASGDEENEIMVDEAKNEDSSNVAEDEQVNDQIQTEAASVAEQATKETDSDETADQVEDPKEKEEICEDKILQRDEKESDEKIVFNEIGAYESEGYEWIELYNYSDSQINLEGWKFAENFKCAEGEEDPKGTKHSLKEHDQGGYVAKGGEFVVIADNADKFRDQYPDFSGLLLDSSWGSLRESGEKIQLLDGNGDIVESFYYEECKDTSLERDDPMKNKWHEHLFGNTVGFENSESLEDKVFPHTIKLNEFMQNPEGKDNDEEWIELYNEDDQDVDLLGWSLMNGSGKVFKLFGEIGSKEYFLIKLVDTSFGLRNSKLELNVLDPKKEVADRVFVEESARSGLSYNKVKNGGWKWSRFLTPGRKNRLNNPPKIKIKKPKKVYKDLYAEFDASKTKDADKDKLKFRWDFGDGHRSYLKETRHKYEENGKYTIELQVDDGSEKVTKSFKVRVKSFPKYELGIVGLVPNPKGKDTGNEIIIIANYEHKELDLEDYFLANGPSRKKLVRHPIYDSFIVGPGEFEEIVGGELCKFSLRNSSGFVALLYPNGKIADIVQYQKEKISDDEMYKLIDGRWEWVGGESPGDVADEKVDVEGEKISVFDPTIEEDEQRCICLRTMQIKNLLYSWENFLDFLELPV